MDEAYIDYVDGSSMGGIINLTSEYPEITFKVLTELNENNGETNISTGWHAIEFLLWGQDFNNFGPGQRPYTDFVIGQGLNAQRRREYLKVATELLVQHLDSVLKQWNKNDEKSYYNEFLNLSDTEALTKVFTSLISMSADELAIERIFVAYDTQFQEDEHSCFSDTTHFDIKYNFLGIKNIWNLVMSSTNIPNLDPNLVLQIQDEIFKVESSIESLVPPFDRAIFDQDQRVILQDIIAGLQQLGNLFKDAGLKLGAAL